MFIFKETYQLCLFPFKDSVAFLYMPRYIYLQFMQLKCINSTGALVDSSIMEVFASSSVCQTELSKYYLLQMSIGQRFTMAPIAHRWQRGSEGFVFLQTVSPCNKKCCGQAFSGRFLNFPLPDVIKGKNLSFTALESLSRRT